jgi:hypothetical protein
MSRLPAQTQSYGHQRIMASRPSRLQPGRERSTIAQRWYPRKRRERLITPLDREVTSNLAIPRTTFHAPETTSRVGTRRTMFHVRETTSRLRTRKTMFLGPRQPTRRTFNLTNVLLLQTRGTLRRIRSTSNSRRSYIRNKNRNTRSSSRSRSRITSVWRNRARMKPGSSK